MSPIDQESILGQRLDRSYVSFNDKLLLPMNSYFDFNPGSITPKLVTIWKMGLLIGILLKYFTEVLYNWKVLI